MYQYVYPAVNFVLRVVDDGQASSKPGIFSGHFFNWIDFSIRRNKIPPFAVPVNGVLIPSGTNNPSIEAQIAVQKGDAEVIAQLIYWYPEALEFSG